MMKVITDAVRKYEIQICGGKNDGSLSTWMPNISLRRRGIVRITFDAGREKDAVSETISSLM